MDIYGREEGIFGRSDSYIVSREVNQRPTVDENRSARFESVMYPIDSLHDGINHVHLLQFARVFQFQLEILRLIFLVLFEEVLQLLGAVQDVRYVLLHQPFFAWETVNEEIERKIGILLPLLEVIFFDPRYNRLMISIPSFRSCRLALETLLLYWLS